MAEALFYIILGVSLGTNVIWYFTRTPRMDAMELLYVAMWWAFVNGVSYWVLL